ncbi:MAG: hypothetical protein WC655_17200 [Candidatus Hydrogenedentales bacterium]|jgi:hypothetical protein
MSQLLTLDPDGKRIPSLTIRIADGTLPQEAATYDITGKFDGSFGWPIPDWDSRLRTLYANVGDYADARFSTQSKRSDEADTEGNLIFTLSPTGMPDPSVGERGFIWTQGDWFIDEEGKLWPFAGYLVHLLMVRMAKGEDVGPIFDEAKYYGANTLVPITMHMSPWKLANGFELDPRKDWTRWQNLLAQTCDLVAAKQMRLAPMCLADTQYGMTDNEKHRAWDIFCETLKGRWNVFGILGNESGANGFRSEDFSRPTNTGGVLYANGSEGQNTPPINAYWDFSLWEPRTGPDYKSFDDAGAGIRELAHGYQGADGAHGPFPCPLVSIENPVFNYVSPDKWGDHRWTNPADALMFGLENGPNAAGGGFGTSQSLEGQPNGAIDAESCRQYYRGLRTSFLR